MPGGLKLEEVDLVDLRTVPTGRRGMWCGGMGCWELGPGTVDVAPPPPGWVCKCWRGWVRATIRRGGYITRKWLTGA